MRVALVSTFPPRRCGIATFTSNLIGAMEGADPDVVIDVAAIDERNAVRAYDDEVRWRIRQGGPAGYVTAAHEIDRAGVDVVCVQHEFGLYGLWQGGGFIDDSWVEGIYEDHLTPFLDELRTPSIVTMHTVLPEPSSPIRDAVRDIASHTDRLVVMAETAVDILRDVYDTSVPATVIPHGMPHIEPTGRRDLKHEMGLDGRQIISTFGLVGPGKGLEFVIEAMPEVVARHPNALYLIAGQTHPELLRQMGESYRNRLVAQVEELGLDDHVMFVNQYLKQKDIIAYLLASDVYVTPYLDPNQITSGTLSYALGAGKAVVSTPYLHAQEALADDRGLLVGFRDPGETAAAINRILDDPALKARLERAAYAYANEATWPRAGARLLEVLGDVAATSPVTAARGERARAPIARRLDANPLLSPADVEPSLEGMEVLSTINPGVTRLGDEIILLVRVAERPRADAVPDDGAQMIDLSSHEPRLRPLPKGLGPEQLVGMSFLDTSRDPGEVVIAYVPRDLPGVDLRDPRTIRVRAAGHASADAEASTDYLTHMSHLRVARSTDGVSFVVDPEPALAASTRLEEYGVEDPRITLIDGVFHITYVAVSRLGITTCRATTTDFRTFERHGVIMHPDQKDVVLFPEQVAGRYVAFTRPMPGSFGKVLGIWLADSDDLTRWGAHRPVALPRPGMWDEARIGASLVPIRVEEGWLELYHGADRTNRYGMGALLLDADDPGTVLARTTHPLMSPETPYERDGFLHDVVFPSGHVDLGDGIIRVYYGASDTHTCAADLTIADVLRALDPV